MTDSQSPTLTARLRELERQSIANANHYAANTTVKAREVAEYWRGRASAFGDISVLLAAGEATPPQPQPPEPPKNSTLKRGM